MSKIPIVQQGIQHSFDKKMKEIKADGLRGLEDLTEFWSSFKKEQPYLAKIVIREMNGFKSQKIMAAFAHGVWMAYAALKSQEEADEMNRDWGIK